MGLSLLFRRSRVRAYLRQRFEGAWYVDAEHKDSYSRDQSVFRFRPEAVVVPRSLEDLGRALELAQEEGLPITPRTGGSSTGGSATGPGILVDMRGESFSKLQVTTTESGPTIIAGPGVRHDQIQRAFREEGHHLPSDPSSGPLSFLGGNIATKASGAHALRYGAIDRYLAQVEMMLPDGRLLSSSADLSSADWDLDAYLSGLAEELPDRLEHRRISKCASGYNLSAAVATPSGTKRLAALACGAVGTLGIVTRAVVTGEPLEPGHALCVLGFATATEAAAHVPSLLATNPSAIELLDERCLALMPTTVKEGFSDTAGALLVAEFSGPEALSRATKAARHAGARLETIWNHAEDANRIEAFWKGRKRMLFSVKTNAGGEGAPSLINDVGVPVESLSRFVRDVERLVSGFSPALYVYGHAGSGNLHLRPDVRGVSQKGQIAMARAVYELVLAYDGTVTGEHGMGRLRAPWLKREWGPEVYHAMGRIKAAMDPSGIMNPDAMFTGRSFEEVMEGASLG